MSVGEPELIQDQEEARATPVGEPFVSISYRSGTGGCWDCQWPLSRLGDALADPRGVVWVDIEDREPLAGKHVESLLRDVFGFHPLAVQDALVESNIPKVDDWGSYLYMVFHWLDFDVRKLNLRLHEMDIFLGKRFLVTYHTEPLEVLNRLRKPLDRGDIGLHANDSADRLLYRLLDLTVSDFLPAIEHMDGIIDATQDEAIHRPSPRTLRRIIRIKRAALRLHRILAPQREVVNRLARDNFAVIAEENRVYFRDIYDHIVRLHDINDTLRDIVAGSLDLYISTLSNRTNEVMKILTLVTVMFLPMNFLAGFFGMNFFGATLELDWSFPRVAFFLFACLLMLATPILIGVFAWWRRWF